jgi:general stress protein 26
MPQEILDYLRSENICVLAVEMLDGSPHGATVHYAHADNPLALFFETTKGYRKTEPLFGRDKTRATVVVGTYESTKKTLQMDGEATLIAPEEEALYAQTYLGKFPQKAKKAESPDFVRFKFVPTWWRLTDFSEPGNRKILTSTDK